MSGRGGIADDLKRQVGEHGYPNCDCDLYDEGDPECELTTPYETHHAYMARLRGLIARLEAEKQEAHTEGWKRPERSHGLDPAELVRDMLGRLEARLKEYETGGETPPERFLEMLRQFRVAVGTAKPESEKDGEL